jgi:hypothetical protein
LDIAGCILIIDNISRQYKMPPSRLKKQKIKKRKTVKKSIPKRVWIYQKGNILYCFRVPFLRILPSPLHGGGLDEGELSNKLFTKLPATEEANKDEGLRKMLESYEKYGDKNSLVKGLAASSIDKKILEELSDSSKNLSMKPGDAGAKLLEWVKARQPARDLMIPILEKLQVDKKLYTPEELRDMEELLNHKKPQNTPGVLSSMTTGAFSTMSKGASSLGSFLTPLAIVGEDGKVPKKRNDTYVQLLWFPRSSIHYRKGKSKDSSKVVDKSDPKYGEFMVYIEPEKYADTMTYMTDRFNSVEDFFANIMDGCSDGLCKTGKTRREPFKHQVIQINNYQPEFDAQENSDELMGGPLSV